MEGFFKPIKQPFVPLAKKRLTEALKVFDDEMASEAVKANVDTYKMMIYACGKAGYALKAKEILKRYRSKGYKGSFGMYANVFLGNKIPLNKTGEQF